jgi:hypothetical protein
MNHFEILTPVENPEWQYFEFQMKALIYLFRRSQSLSGLGEAMIFEGIQNSEDSKLRVVGAKKAAEKCILPTVSYDFMTQPMLSMLLDAFSSAVLSGIPSGTLPVTFAYNDKYMKRFV